MKRSSIGVFHEGEELGLIRELLQLETDRVSVGRPGGDELLEERAGIPRTHLGEEAHRFPGYFCFPSEMLCFLIGRE